MLYKDYPKKWRYVSGVLFLIYIVFLISILLLWIYFGNNGHWHSIKNYNWIIIVLAGLSGLLHLAIPKKSPIKHENLIIAGNLFFVFAGSIAMLLTFYFEGTKQIKTRAHATWAFSQFCSEDGAIKQENAITCVRLINHLDGKLCILGEKPMRECEAQLRQVRPPLKLLSDIDLDKRQIQIDSAVDLLEHIGE